MSNKMEFHVWPKPNIPGVNRGPTPKQKLLFIEDLPDPEPGMTPEQLAWCRPHYHPQDVVLFIGAARCFGKGTELRMFDGTVKKVEDLVKGDVLIGPDGLPRTVAETSTDEDYMYKVTSKDAMSFICNSQHLLNLREKNGTIVRIAVEEYLKLQPWAKARLWAWRPDFVEGRKAFRIKVIPVGPGRFYSFRVAEDNCDILLADGTVACNSGKTCASSARVISFLLKNKGAVGIVGALTLGFLQRTVIDQEWKPRFSVNSAWDHLKLPNRLILRRPAINKMEVDFHNGSICHFLHFAQEDKIKGLNASIVDYEECDLLPNAKAFEEVLARLANPVTEVRQFILTTNPVKARQGWVKKKFKLGQLDPRFTGKKEPIVPPCNCQFCPKCVNTGQGNFGYVDSDGNPSTKKGSHCSNPNCAYIEQIAPMSNGVGFPFPKDNNCPGNQVFYRIIETSSNDNPFKASDYEQTAKAGMSKKTSSAMIDGAIEQDHEGEVYLAYSRENINYAEPVVLDYSKDLVWSMDQDENPHSSIILQETETDTSIRVDVIDEILEWDCLPELAAKIFCQRYHAFKDTENYVKVWSDPAALYGKGKRKLNFYKKILNYLTAPTNENGDIDLINGKPFKVKPMMNLNYKPNYKNKNAERLQVKVEEKVHCLNNMLCNDRGERRIFINESCEALIMSLEGVKWVAGKNEIDKSVDKKAKEDQETLSVMTHHSDALGYYAAKRFPLIKHKSGTIIVSRPGVTTTIYKDGKIYKAFADELKSESIAQQRKMKREKEEKEKKVIRKEKPKSARDFVKKAGFIFR